MSSSLARTWTHKLPLLSLSDKSLGLVGSSKGAFPAVPAQSEESPGVSWCSEERHYETKPEYLLTEIFMAVIPHRFLRVALVAEPLLPTQTWILFNIGMKNGPWTNSFTSMCFIQCCTTFPSKASISANSLLIGFGVLFAWFSF